MFFTKHKKVNYTNESVFINKNHKLMKHLNELQMFYARTFRIFLLIFQLKSIHLALFSLGY